MKETVKTLIVETALKGKPHMLANLTDFPLACSPENFQLSFDFHPSNAGHSQWTIKASGVQTKLILMDFVNTPAQLCSIVGPHRFTRGIHEQT